MPIFGSDARQVGVRAAGQKRLWQRDQGTTATSENACWEKTGGHKPERTHALTSAQAHRCPSSKAVRDS